MTVLILALLAQPADPLTAELERRGLTGLLEHQLRTRLAGDAPLEQRAAAALALAESVSERADAADDPEERERLWREAEEAAAPVLTAPPNFSPLMVPRYRYGGLLLRRARLLKELGELEGDGESLRQARRWADVAAERLHTLLEDVATVIGFRNRGEEPVGDDLTAEELTGLWQAVRFREGVSLLTVAEATEADRRAAALGKARPILERYVVAFATDRLTLEAHLAMAELERLAGNPDAARTLLRRVLDAAGVDEDFRRRATLTLAETELAAGNPAAAVALLDVPVGRRSKGAAWPLALMDALLRQSQTEGADRTALQRRALAVLDEVEERHGRYWAARGERLLARFVRPEMAGDDVQLLTRLGSVLRGEKKYAEALAAYRKAAAQAEREGDAGTAAKALYGAALMQYQTGDFAAGAAAMTDVADRFAGAEIASQARLAAAYAWSAAYDKDARPEYAASYRQALQRHLDDTPQSDPTHAQALWALAELDRREGRWQDALAGYRRVPPGAERFHEALAAVGSLTLEHADEHADEAGQPRRLLEAAVLTVAEGLRQGGDTDAVAAATARLALGELYLRPEIDQPQRAAELFEQVLATAGVDAKRRGRAAARLLAAAIAAGDAPQARSIVADRFEDTEALFAALAPLNPQDPLRSQEVRLAEDAAVGAAFRKLQPQLPQLSPTDRLNLQLLYAQATAHAGSHEQAQTMFRYLIKQFPQDRRLHVALAASLLADGKHDAALKAWAQLQRSSPRGTPEWLEASLGMLQALAGRGDVDEALSGHHRLRTLFPDLGTPALKRRFETFAADLNRRRNGG